MKALSVRQPFAFLIVSGAKPVENRVWGTHYRGPLLIHAGLDYHAMTFADIEQRFRVAINPCDLQLGGLIGIADLVDVVWRSSSIWFTGPRGWLLENPRRFEFLPYRGQQGMFDVPDELIKSRL